MADLTEILELYRGTEEIGEITYESNEDSQCEHWDCDCHGDWSSDCSHW